MPRDFDAVVTIDRIAEVLYRDGAVLRTDLVLGTQTEEGLQLPFYGPVPREYVGRAVYFKQSVEGTLVRQTLQVGSVDRKTWSFTPRSPARGVPEKISSEHYAS